MNNLVNNTNRGQVVIGRTEAKGLENFTGLNKEIHAAMARKALRDTLYSWAPVYKMVTITGVTEEGDLEYKIQNVIGGNSPVARAFIQRNTDARNMAVIQIDDSGSETFRDIVVGMDGKIRYDYTEEIVLVKFKGLGGFTKAQQQASEALVNNILSKGLTINENDKVVVGKDEGLHVNPLIWTPSNERNGQILMTSIDHNIAWTKLESIGGGAITRKLAGEMAVAKFKKLASRLGLFATPAIEFAEVGTNDHGLLLLDHELLSEEDFSAIAKQTLLSVGVEIDAKQWDGAAFFSADFALQGLKNIGMKRIDIKKAMMFAFQLRVSDVYAKVFGEALHQSVLNKMAKYIMSELDKIEATTGKKLYRVYGNTNSISMILDSNAAKIVDLEMETDSMMVYLLDIAKGSQSGTATQMTDKFAIANKAKTAEFLRNRGLKDCTDYANSIGDNSSSLLDENINVWQTLINIGKNVPADSEIAYNVFSDQFIMSKLMKDVSKKHEAAYRKGRVSIESEFERALFDSTYLLTDGKISSLLKVDNRGAIECYSTDVLEKYADEIAVIENNTELSIQQQDELLTELLTACVIKYPTPGTEEIELVVFKTEKQIRRRVMTCVEDGIIDMDTAKVVFNYFSFTSYGVIKIAADNAVKHKLAGMDTDYDGVVVIFEKELVNIIVDMYLARKNNLEETTGLIASHGGTIPFIDSAKDAKNFFDKSQAEELKKDYSSYNIIGSTVTFDKMFE